MNKKLSTSLLASCITLLGAGCYTSEQPLIEKIPTQTSVENKVLNSVFSIDDAKSNLAFSKNQYVKLINNIEQNKHITFSSKCLKEGVFCFPRSEEEGEIYMEKPEKWTNGFYPGLLWKILSVSEHIGGFSDEEKNLILEQATISQEHLKSESKRTSTHDLGFILYDSYGEALNVKSLDKQKREAYEQILNVGRDTLVKRFSSEYGVIKSWDFVATLSTKYLENGKILKTSFELSSPWTYPVIVDNMMNLDFLFDTNDEKYRNLAFTHAETTQKNHYFYLEDDTKQERPLSYHLIDYGTMKPGNWQGLGSISAWARGQAWSLYGFVTVVEAAKNSQLTPEQINNFEIHLERLFNSVSYLLKNDTVPLWDFLANEPNAAEYAENMASNTTAYSRIVDLCDHEIPKNTLPYIGYKPVLLEADLITKDAFEKLSTLTSVKGESFISDGKIAPCGTQPYNLVGREIPKDTSAAAIIASALYRYAQTTDDAEKGLKFSDLADKIMAELTKTYLTTSEHKSYDLGFVMNNATGNLPNTSEINTSILYADFYFIEANIRKLQLAIQK